MAQEERIKGLETISKTLGERLDSVDEKLKNLLKSSEESTLGGNYFDCVGFDVDGMAQSPGY